jgi:hypothetical protein
MTQEDIIRMAREANVYCTTRQPTLDAMLERFAALVRAEAQAEEREACAKVCDELNFIDNGTPANTRATNRHCAAAIRARENT